MYSRGRLISTDKAHGSVRLSIASNGRIVSVQLDGSVEIPPIGSFVGVEVEGSNAPRVILLGPAPAQVGADATRWWRPYSSGTSRMDRLRQRARMIRAIRDTFDTDEFLEVQSPLLLRATCPDTHIDSFAVGKRFLATSTEYQLKRMFAGGFERLYSLTQNFREGDLGPYHNDEFTMLEWARAYESMDAIERDVERVVKAALDALNPEATSVELGEHLIAIREVPWERLSVREALRRHLGVESDEDFSLGSLRSEVERLRLEIPEAYCQDQTDLITLLLDRIQPALGAEVPTFLVEWPSFLTTSAPLVLGRPGLAERSELFIGGIEVADGFPFLCDGALQAQLFDRANESRVALGKPRLAPDQKFLEALDGGLPPGAGMALGVDRLVMALTGELDIHNVLAFSADEL